MALRACVFMYRMMNLKFDFVHTHLYTDICKISFYLSKVNFNFILVMIIKLRFLVKMDTFHFLAEILNKIRFVWCSVPVVLPVTV